MDIKQQIKEYLNKRNASLTSVVNMINSFKPKEEQTTVQNINNKLTRGTIKYSEVLEIAQVLGYDIVWQEQKSNELNLSAFKLEDIVNNSNNIQTDVNYSRIQENPMNVFVDQEIQRFYSKLLTLLLNYDFPHNVEQYIKSNLSVASINFQSLPLSSFIFTYTNFLCEALSYTVLGNDFLPMITYLNNIYYQGTITKLTEAEKQNLITSFKYLYEKYFKNIKQKDLFREVNIYDKVQKD